MKDLLYLRDEQIKDFIQLLLYAYRETFSDPKEILKKNSFGAAHQRTLYLVERNQGISVNELLFKLKISSRNLGFFFNQFLIVNKETSFLFKYFLLIRIFPMDVYL